MKRKREKWSSRMGFILAAAGSAVGLGNVWKFPYIAGENGGAAFIFIYLMCILVIGLPVLIAEVLMGRATHRNPVGAFRTLSNSKFWTAIGGMGVFAGFVILSFYSVVAGWSVGYIVEAVKGSFYDYETMNSAGEHFNSLVSNVYWIIGYLAAFMIITMLLVYRGVQKGIERGSKILMPILFVILIVLMIRGLTLQGAEAGLSFLWSPDWSKITANSVLVALGHAFFTLSLGMGAMMTYGSYMTQKGNIPLASTKVAFLDTIIALIAGMAIFTAVFAVGLDPAAGPGLIFHTLPVVFTKMPGGYIFAILFFILLTIAALTSAISLLEVVVAYFVDERGWKRHRAVIVFGMVVFLVGVPSALSYNLMSNVTLFGMTFFDLADYLASNILLPLGGLCIAVFVAWIWGFDKALIKMKHGAESIFENNKWIIVLWKFFLKYFAPILIFFVFLSTIGVLPMIIEFFSNLFGIVREFIVNQIF